MRSDTRRAFLRGALSVPPLLAQAAHAATPANTEKHQKPHFPGVAYPDYPRCLPDYLRGLAAAAHEKRNAALARITSAQSARDRQAWVRKTLLDLIGDLPEKTDLHPRVVGSFDREGYRVERVVYESRPKLYVSANLYIPTNAQPPFPGVLFQLGHSWNGKAWDSYQKACQGLVRLGFLVLACDPMGQGERIYYPDGTGIHTRLSGGSDGEHTVPGKQMLLAGTTCTEFQLWDAIRSLDYLASHPMVDPKRLASTGQSGGATLTMLLAAADDRLKAAAVFSGNTENFACRNFLPPGSTDDAEQNLVGAGPLGFDRWDLLYAFAPKPLLISISDKDSFGTYSPNYVVNSWDEYQKLAHFYGLMGAGKQLSWSDTPLPHGLSYDSRMQMYEWMCRHLKESAPQSGELLSKEPPVTLEPDSKLWVSKDGSLMRSLGGETPFSVTKKRAASIAKAASVAPLDRLLGVERPRAEARAVSLKKVRSEGGVTIEALDIPSASRVHLPAWLFRPAQDDSKKPVLLILHPAGRNAAWKEGEIFPELAVSGVSVCAIDVRGIGDLMPEFSPGAPHYARPHELEEDYAWASMMLGKPLLGQRVTDTLAAVQALRTSFGFRGRNVAIAAFGKMTVPALFAASLAPEVSRVYLAGGLSSYREIVNTEDFSHPFANFLPKILAHTDLPEVAAGLAPRSVVIAGAVDARDLTHRENDVRKIYGAALSRGNVEVRKEASWTIEALKEFVG